MGIPTKLLLHILLLLTIVGCASTPPYAGQECESVVDFDECVQCFVSSNWIGSRSYNSNPKGIEFLIDSGQYLTQGVIDGRITRTRARSLFSTFMRSVGAGHTIQQSQLVEAGIPLTHPYVLANSVGNIGNSGGGSTPCVYSSCGSVQVKGYFRKDGTYVRPHTRSSSGSGGRRR